MKVLPLQKRPFNRQPQGPCQLNADLDINNNCIAAWHGGMGLAVVQNTTGNLRQLDVDTSINNQIKSSYLYRGRTDVATNPSLSDYIAGLEKALNVIDTDATIDDNLWFGDNSGTNGSHEITVVQRYKYSQVPEASSRLLNGWSSVVAQRSFLTAIVNSTTLQMAYKVTGNVSVTWTIPELLQDSINTTVMTVRWNPNDAATKLVECHHNGISYLGSTTSNIGAFGDADGNGALKFGFESGQGQFYAFQGDVSLLYVSTKGCTPELGRRLSLDPYLLFDQPRAPLYPAELAAGGSAGAFHHYRQTIIHAV